jgi:NADPH2:quinone reductase
MRAIVQTKEGLVMKEVAKPAVVPGFILIEVKANAINRADVLMLHGAVHQSGGWGTGADTPFGLEWAGEVVELGDGVKGFKVGDRVMGSGSGAFAEYLLAYPMAIYRCPDNMSFEQAACLPVALQTMHDAVIITGQLTKGKTIFFQGGSSAVGLIGMQIAKYQKAGKIIASSNVAERVEKLPSLGADVAVNTNDKDWVDQVLKATDGKGVDILIDFVAGPTVVDSLRCMKVGGCMVNIGRMAGESGEFNFDLHNQNRITYLGCSFRARTLEESIMVILKTSMGLGTALKKGAFQMPIDKVFPFEQFKEALERMDTNQNFGKIVLVH